MSHLHLAHEFILPLEKNETRLYSIQLSVCVSVCVHIKEFGDRIFLSAILSL